MADPVPGAELAPVEHRQEVARPADVLPSDDEIRRIYRIAEALHLGGAFKDIGSAERAFSKMIIGRDLGLTPAQSMTGIHLVEGGIQMHYSTLGMFVRSRDGYDFRAGWIKRERTVEVDVADAEAEGGVKTLVGRVIKETPHQQHGRVFQVRFPSGREATLADREVRLSVSEAFVWHDEEDPLDEREVHGAAVLFTVDGEQRGLSRYTADDAQAAGLIKPDKAKSGWMAARRNMLLARAMSNGVKWFVPEVMNGLPIYAEGELEAARERKSLTESTSDADDAGSGVDLGPDVEKIIARAEELGHRGLSNRAAIELAVGQRAPGVVKSWVGEAKAELDRFAAEKAKAAEDAAADGAPSEAAAEVAEEPVEEDLTTTAPEVIPPVDADADAEPVAAEVVDAPGVSRDPQAHVGHRVVLARTEGAPDVLRCEDCDVVLDPPDSVEMVPGGESAAEPDRPPVADPHDAIRDTVEGDGGTVEQ